MQEEKNIFNKESRIKNVLRISFVGVFVYLLRIVFAFVYRHIFVKYLTSQYLGLNGLFSSVFQMLSLAELGITTAIIYRFYEPVSKGDIHYVGMLMNFFKKIYRIIAIIILIIGIILIPFIPFFIKDMSEVPSDVNIYIVYVLCLIGSVSTYLFSYKLTLLSVDQKDHINSIISFISTFIQYALKIALLIVTKKYILTLAVDIFTTIIINILSSIWVTNHYKEIFIIKDNLSENEKKKIYYDTGACMCHKIGGTVLTATDNIVLTKIVSLSATGIFSNYSMIITYIHAIVSQALGNFNASIGNAKNNLSDSDYYSLFKKNTFLTLWIASIITTCLFASIDDFIFLWLGEDYVFPISTTTLICIQLFLTLSRTSNGSFINADGLFIKDKIRPLIEALINLVVSIIFTKKYGINGVILGTIVSAVLTVQWREIYILFKYSFKRKMADYWYIFIQFALLTVINCVIIFILTKYIYIKIGWFQLFTKAIFVFIVSNIVYIFLFRKNDEYKYYVTLIKNIKSYIK